MPRWRDWDNRGFYPPSRPRAAKGGIRAQSQRGAFGESWWAKRWMAILEGFDIGSRLQRGRRYARGGQVLTIDVSKGHIEATVQGSRPRPYEVTIDVKPLSEAAWKKVAGAAASQVAFTSKLLGGEMPREMEQAFRAAGVSLFPERYDDLRTECSCPDWSNPCKHIAAVYCLLGEEFNRDPFLIFRMRGMNRDEFLALLGKGGTVRPADAVALPPEPLPEAPSRFYSAGPIPDDPAAGARTTAAGAALARRLGSFPFWRGRTLLIDFLEKTYSAAARNAANVLEGK